MSTKYTVSPTEIRAHLKEQNINSSMRTIKRDIHEIKNQNWQWLNDTAKGMHLNETHDRAIMLKEAMKLTMKRINNPDTKDGAIAMLNNSLANLSSELRDIIEGEGLFVNFQAIHEKTTEWKKDALTPNPDLDSTLV